MTTPQEYYSLKRDGFSIDPRTDADVYFGARDLEVRIRGRIESDFLNQRRVPKFFVHGPWGAGKTHTLAHIEHVLTNDDELERDFGSTSPLLIEMPVLKARDQWAKLHRHFVDAIGRELVRGAVETLCTNHPGSDPVQVLLEQGDLRFGDRSLRESQAQVLRTLLFDALGGPQSTIAWDWLKGEALKADQRASLNVDTTLDRPDAMVCALLNLGSLISKATGRKIVLLVDEAEQLRSVSQPDSVQEYIYAIRRLADSENNVVGLVMGYQQEDGEDAPPILENEAIRRRVGYENGYVDLTGLVAAIDDAWQFARQVLGHLVDRNAAQERIAAEQLETTPDLFPFTEGAIDRLVAFVTEEPEKQMPSRIIDLLQDAVSLGFRSGRNSGSTKLIDEDLMDEILYPDEAGLGATS